MKKLYTGIIVLALGAGIYAFPNNEKPTKTVNLERPGTLAERIPAKKLKGAKRLKINGAINNDDIIYLRRLCGVDSNDNAMPTTYITEVDLSGVTFDNSTGTDYFANLGSKKSSKYGIDGANVLPGCMFYHTGIEQIVLPATLDSIAPFALSYTRLTDLEIPGNVAMAWNAVTCDSALVNLSLGRLENFHELKNIGLPALKHITFSDIDYVSSGMFDDMAELETVTFDGLIGHIDGYQFSNNPRLRTVTFNGPILTTGGAQVAENCPELERITFNAMVGNLGLTEFADCPKIDTVTVNGTFNDADYQRLTAYEMRQFGKKGFLKKLALMVAPEMAETGRRHGSNETADRLMEAYEKFRDVDDDKTKLQILKESAGYATERDTTVGRFTYQAASDSALTDTRLYYNLDSIAGNGDDVSRIKNLTYWIHDLVAHDGSSEWPKCLLTIREIEKVCKSEKRGVNCRMMAIMLTEACLAEGIPARYLTCQSKKYDEDSDCHVICIAWSRELGKWIWADPTFAAFVTDENGTPLHPGEVRSRLIDDQPLVINEDANWNHRHNETKEHYLDQYMAKNLYIIESRVAQEAAPEGAGSSHKPYVALVPVGFQYLDGSRSTSDAESFWTAP